MQQFVLSLCLSCAGYRRCCSGRWVLVGKSSFSPWQQLAAISVSRWDFPPSPVLLLRLKVIRYRHVQGRPGKGAGTPLRAGGGGGVSAAGGVGAGCTWGLCHCLVAALCPFRNGEAHSNVDFPWTEMSVPACLSRPAAGWERDRAEVSCLKQGLGRSPLCC